MLTRSADLQYNVIIVADDQSMQPSSPILDISFNLEKGQLHMWSVINAAMSQRLVQIKYIFNGPECEGQCERQPAD